MGCVINYRLHDRLRRRRLNTITKAIKERLPGRAESAYLFGSSARGDFKHTSDVDLIIIKSTSLPFTKRFREFLDLKDIFAGIDVPVYTPAEFESALRRNDAGFWKKVPKEMKRIM